MVIIYFIIMFIIPIFQFVGFVGDGYNEVQNIFQEMKKFLLQSLINVVIH